MSSPASDVFDGVDSSKRLRRATTPGLGLGLAIGAVVAIVAWESPTAALLLAATAAATVLFASFPAALLGLLIAAVLGQDLLVSLGIQIAQQADEALIAVGILAVAARAVVLGHVRRTPLDLPLLAFLAASLASAAVQQVPAAIAVLGTLALVKGLLAFQLTARIHLGRENLRRSLDAILAAAGLFAAIGMLQRIGGLPVYRLTGKVDYYLSNWQGTKAPSIFAHHNALGHVCVMGGTLALGLAVTSEGRRRRQLLLVAGTCLAGLVASASRESWLAAAAALVIVAVLTGSRRIWRVALFTAGILVIGGGLVYFGSPLLHSEIARRAAGVVEGWDAFRLGFTGMQFRGEYRVYVLLKSWEIFVDNPVFGTGPGLFGGHVASLFQSPIYEEYSFLPLDGVYQPLDVFWSRLLTEFGLVGTAPFLWAIAVAAGAVWSASRHGDPLTRGIGLGGLMALPAVIVFGVFSPALEDPLVAVLMWAWAGLCWSRACADADHSFDDGRGSPASGAAEDAIDRGSE